MKTNLAARFLLPAVLLFAIAVATGCKTTTVDWNSRVGSYTYDSAVAEMGPPDKQSKLKDGKSAYQWITLHGSNGFSSGGSLNNNYGMGVGQPITQSYKDHVLELTFGPDGKLVSWARNY